MFVFLFKTGKKMAKISLWVLGDAVVDLVPLDERSYLKCPGGAPANVAVALARLSARSGFIGRVGDDPFGRFMEKTLQKEGVETRFLHFDPQHRTSTVLVDLDKNGERSFTFLVQPSADQFLSKDELPTFSKGDWLHTCSVALIGEVVRASTQTALSRLKAAGGRLSFDPNLRPALWDSEARMREETLDFAKHSDLLKVSEEELLFLTGTESLSEGILAARALSLPLILITLSKAGALSILKGGEPVMHKGMPVEKVVDTTGAGDAFIGGVLAALSGGLNIPESQVYESQALSKAIQWGNLCGRLSTLQRGAMSALPSLSQLEAAERDGGIEV